MSSCSVKQQSLPQAQRSTQKETSHPEAVVIFAEKLQEFMLALSLFHEIQVANDANHKYCTMCLDYLNPKGSPHLQNIQEGLISKAIWSLMECSQSGPY